MERTISMSLNKQSGRKRTKGVAAILLAGCLKKLRIVLFYLKIPCENPFLMIFHSICLLFHDVPIQRDSVWLVIWRSL